MILTNSSYLSTKFACEINFFLISTTKISVKTTANVKFNENNVGQKQRENKTI